KLQNINTYEWFELDMNLLAHDRVVIDTNKGRKSVKLVRGGVETNIINHMVWGSTFLQLEPGVNEIVCQAGTGIKSLSVTIRFSERYGGV
ncbi:MAG: phage tail family protein, partial [Oscillospiraceae bacterium]|nr:phage tail family protein [Oscillospiraceae bacterium]